MILMLIKKIKEKIIAINLKIEGKVVFCFCFVLINIFCFWFWLVKISDKFDHPAPFQKSMLYASDVYHRCTWGVLGKIVNRSLLHLNADIC